MSKKYLIPLTLLTILFIILGLTYNARNNTPSTQNNNQKEALSTEAVDLEKRIVADLKTMTLTIHEEDGTEESLRIISKGKPGTYYETPAGEYTAKYKSVNHFSRLGEVYMPYSVQFYANFFIHGIPYYPNGEKVSSNYSGGCIRLADEDAKKVYDAVERGTKIIIKNSDTISANNLKLSSDKSKTLMTILVATESINQEKFVNYKNQKVQIKNLLDEVAAGDTLATNIIYNQLGRYNFEDLIKEKATAIGIEDPNFQNEIDRQILINYIANNKIFLLKFL